MNKKSLMLAAMLLGVGSSFAQIGSGGFPLSFKNSVESSSNPITLKNATFESYLKGNQPESAERYEVGWGIPAEMNMMEKGSWTQMPDGSSIYTLSIRVPDAKALALYYKDFYLPKGVKMYLYNANKKQVLGAYDNTTSPDSRIFSNQPIIGEELFLELNVEKGVKIADIALDLNFVGAYYRGVETEAVLYADETPLEWDPPIGTTASCHINALCPQGDEQAKSRKSTLRIVIADGPNNPLGNCTGTLINNTGNEANGTCKPLFLTASHCDSENGMSDAHFQYWQFRFDYQLSACTNGAAPTTTNSPTMTGGAKFKARSYYPTFPSTNPESSSLVQDFLLLELNGTLPSGYYLNGWNRAPNLHSNTTYYNTFYGFHHPSGDVKKLSVGETVAGGGTFNQNTVPATHWSIEYYLGGTSPGSSGSGLFDVNGLLVGDLSGGASGTCPADGKKYSASALYSKISYGWENAYDQTAFPAHAGATSRLKDHLDPLNLGLGWLETTESDNCSDFTSVKLNKLNATDVHLYPVPATGVLNIQVNLNETADFTGAILDVSGREVKKFTFNNRNSNVKSINVDQLTNGIYFLTLSSELGNGQYKFVITK